VRSRTLIIAIILTGCSSATASIIYESATFGGGSTGGLSISQEQFVGARFTIDTPVHITAIGGDIGAFPRGSIFGVILSLSGPNALPSGSPFDTTTIASVLFQAPFPSQDLTIPLSSTLNPGIYGVVFGSGQFGATGSAFATTEGLSLPVFRFSWKWRRRSPSKVQGENA
jgi:hypothetical protein